MAWPFWSTTSSILRATSVKVSRSGLFMGWGWEEGRSGCKREHNVTQTAASLIRKSGIHIAAGHLSVALPLNGLITCHNCKYTHRSSRYHYCHRWQPLNLHSQYPSSTDSVSGTLSNRYHLLHTKRLWSTRVGIPFIHFPSSRPQLELVVKNFRTTDSSSIESSMHARDAHQFQKLHDDLSLGCVQCMILNVARYQPFRVNEERQLTGNFFSSLHKVTRYIPRKKTGVYEHLDLTGTLQ